MKNLLALLVILFASCKTVSLKQEYKRVNGQREKVGEPQLFKIDEGETYYRIYRVPAYKFKKKN